MLRHLAVAAEGWESLGRPESELYRGARLEAAQEYGESSSADLTAAERDFLDASLRQSASERAALRARARIDARQNRRLRVLLTAAVSSLVVAAGAGIVADRRGDDAQRAADQATIEALVNESLVLRSTDRDAAALLAVEAHRRWPDDPRTLSALVGSSPVRRGSSPTDTSMTLTRSRAPSSLGPLTQSWRGTGPCPL